ncbi:hypothetical protein TREVI0001_1416 [Treponema vincentii ATCC 35580]|uniref:Uncharacterized protein n=1 Tax=Treponema vincentii ATCC 35580 TaxID=596324 RepID=C8PPV5_9SPIR|nr:hypothetical protein TREVI0001_1416 [Treponema vincentii ATCC 35580]
MMLPVFVFYFHIRIRSSQIKARFKIVSPYTHYRIITICEIFQPLLFLK